MPWVPNSSESAMALICQFRMRMHERYGKVCEAWTR
jgi:hypothetical protein